MKANERQLPYLRERLEREIARRRAFRNDDPVDAVCFIVSLMEAIDSRTGDAFTFEHVREPLEDGEAWMEGNALRCKGWDGPARSRGGQKDWRWQRYLVERAVLQKRRIDLKGRQLGDTWCLMAVDVAKALRQPGSDSLLFRQKEPDAIDNVRRWWTLFGSLPPWLLQKVPSGKKVGPVVVSKPDRGDRPGRDGVSLKFADGRFSDIVPMTSAAESGHGRSTRDVNLDEASRIENLETIRGAIEPASGEVGHVSVVSTANGRSNPETGEGNHFHWLWTNEGSGYDRIFLGYYLHPDRDEWWYENSAEVQSLPIHKRQEQFPRNEHEAFALSERVFFDPEALMFYSGHVEEPRYRFDFKVNLARAEMVKSPSGRIHVFREPTAGHTYAIGADVAGGSGLDSSSAFVVDLSTMEWAAEYHAKVGEDVFAEDLHFLGRVYGNALIAPETQGGHGTAVVIALRDGTKGRPPYPKLYRHRNQARYDRPDVKAYGMPMNAATRPLIVNQIEQHVRDRTLPFVTPGLLHEMGDFIEHNRGTSPRARDGAHDDRVMAAAIALDLFRRFGMTQSRAGVKIRRARERRRLKGGIDESRYPSNARS